MTTDTVTSSDREKTVRRPHAWLWAAFAGIVSAAVLLAVAEALAALIARSASPILAVGSFIVDIVPRPLKELAITLFGEADKVALLAGVGLGAAVAAGQRLPNGGRAGSQRVDDGGAAELRLERANGRSMAKLVD